MYTCPIRSKQSHHPGQGSTSYTTVFLKLLQSPITLGHDYPYCYCPDWETLEYNNEQSTGMQCYTVSTSVFTNCNTTRQISQFNKKNSGINYSSNAILKLLQAKKIWPNVKANCEVICKQINCTSICSKLWINFLPSQETWDVDYKSLPVLSVNCMSIQRTWKRIILFSIHNLHATSFPHLLQCSRSECNKSFLQYWQVYTIASL